MAQMARRTVAALVLLLIGVQAVTPAPVIAAELIASESPGRLTPNQLVGGGALTPAEALAACGPAAAVAFANATGRSLSLDAAVAVAREVGWTAARGMTGPYGELALLRRLNVPATVEAGLDAARVRREVAAGRPVIIRTAGRGSSIPGHYFVAERFDAGTGQFDLAQSALVLRSSGGRRWFALDEIASLGTGAPTHAIYLATEPSVQLVAASIGTATAISARTSSMAPGSRIVATGGPGARLRAGPGTASKIVGALPDGFRVTATGATATVEGQLWQRVQVSGDTAAWVDASLLRAS